MRTQRLEAFSDGVIAILITIMVLELRSDQRQDPLGQPPPVVLAVAPPVLHGLEGENHFAKLPTAAYGLVLLLASLAYFLLQAAIVAEHGSGSKLAVALGRDLKGKVSPVIYVLAIPLAFLNRWVALAMYVLVALIWLVPDRRLEHEAAASGSRGAAADQGGPRDVDLDA